MRSIALTVAFSLLASVAMGGLSGTYTIKPGGGGNFLSLFAAGEALDSLGMSGNCIFEVYGDTQYASCYLGPVAGSESWTTTFRPGPGQSPVLLTGDFAGSCDNVKVEDLEFMSARVTVSGVSGWRIRHCRFTYLEDWGVSLEECAKDTVDGCTFQVLPWANYEYAALQVTLGSDHLLFNNMVNSDSCPLDALVKLEHTRNTRFVFNTVRLSPLDAAISNAIEIAGDVPCEVRNNVFVVAVPADSVNACVSVNAQPYDSILLDYNCYFVESQGHVGAKPFYPNLYDWGEWRGLGFEPHGINADPRLKSATDLHVRSGSPCNTRATPIAGISVDIDGDPRDPTHPDMGADEIAGSAVGESSPLQATSSRLAPTIVRCLLMFQPAIGAERQARGELLDVAGRTVMELRPGANDVRRLPPGVYSVREAVNGERSTVSVRKVVVTK